MEVAVVARPKQRRFPVVKARPYQMGSETAPLWTVKGHFTERNANRRAREAIAAELEADFERTFAIFREGIDTAGIEAGVRSGNLATVQQAIGIERAEGRLASEVLNRLLEAVDSGAQLGLRFAPPQLSGVPVELVTEASIGFVEQHGGALIEGITERTRAGVQRALSDALIDQISPTEAAARIGDLVGLRPDQVRAVNRFRANLEAQLIPVPEAETALVRDLIERRVTEESRRQLRARGRLIGDTEVQNAIQEGERTFWRVAGDEGAVDLALVTKTWRTANDGRRVCPICMPMHGQEVGQADSFSSPAGWTGIGPPAHPRCRCYIVWLIAGEQLAA